MLFWMKVELYLRMYHDVASGRLLIYVFIKIVYTKVPRAQFFLGRVLVLVRGWSGRKVRTILGCVGMILGGIYNGSVGLERDLGC